MSQSRQHKKQQVKRIIKELNKLEIKRVGIFERFLKHLTNEDFAMLEDKLHPDASISGHFEEIEKIEAKQVKLKDLGAGLVVGKFSYDIKAAKQIRNKKDLIDLDIN